MLECNCQFVEYVAFSVDGQVLATADTTAAIRLWNICDGTQLDRLEVETEAICVDNEWSTCIANVWLAFTPDGTGLLSVDDDWHLWIWDLARRSRTLFGEPYELVYTAALSPDGRTIAIAGGSGSLSLWDKNSARVLGALRAKRSLVHALYSLTFSPDGETLALTAGKGIYLFRRLGGGLVRQLRGHNHTVLDAAYSPNGRLIASASIDNTVRIWLARTGSQLVELRGDGDVMTGVAFSHDGRFLAAGTGFLSTTSGDPASSVCLWELGDLERRIILKGHRDRVGPVAFSPNRLLLASGSADGTVRIWDVC